MKKNIFIVLFLIIGILSTHQAYAASQLWGWLWSENIGWISINSRNSNMFSHWQLVDEAGGDRYNSYIWSTSSCWEKDSYNIQDPPVGLPEDIVKVEIFLQSMNSVWVGARLNGVELNWPHASVTTVPGNWGNKKVSLPHPGGGNWTWNELKNLQLTVSLRNTASGNGILSQIYLRAERAGGGEVILRPNGPGDYTGVTNQFPDPDPAIDYRVVLNEATGFLSGYAWSENIGWIKFNPAGPYPSAPNYSACVNLPGTSGEVCQADLADNQMGGWARVCSAAANPDCTGGANPNSGGWDGWIKLRGLDYGLSLIDSFPNLLGNPCCSKDVLGWSWGENVVGWLSFNRRNCDPNEDGLSNGLGSCPAAGTAVGNYKATNDQSNIILNNPPSADFVCSKTPCQAYQGDADLYFTNTSTDLEGLLDIASSRWSTKLQSEPEGSYVSQLFCSIDPILCDYTVNTAILNPSSWHTVKLSVADHGSLSDDKEMDFYILKDIVASFECSEDGSVWTVCSDITPIEGDAIYVNDTSTLSEGAGGIIDRTWDVDGIVFGSGSNQEMFQAAGLNIAIRLTITDSNGRTDSVTQQITGVMPLPKWREIAPF